jgi:hypothetical protein
VSDPTGGFAGDNFKELLENLSNLANLIGIFVLASFIPLYGWMRRVSKERKEKRRKEEDDHIIQLTTAVTKPILDQISVMNRNIDIMNTKVGYIEEVFRDNITFGPHGGNTDEGQTQRPTHTKRRGRGGPPPYSPTD